MGRCTHNWISRRQAFEEIHHRFRYVRSIRTSIVTIDINLNSFAAVCIFCIGVIVQTAAFHPSSIYGGKFEAAFSRT